ncbi:MAG: histidine kinase [Aquabacterium sp.]|nr:histidine kinase [Aquabacterium sp.]
MFLSIALRHCRDLVCCLLFSLLASTCFAQVGAQPTVSLQADHVTVLREANITSEGLTPPSMDGAWQPILLPHLWRDTHPGYQGVMWYRFRVTINQLPQVPWAVYLPRVSLNAQVWVNGVPMPYTGSMSTPVTRNWYVPLLAQTPAGIWHQGDNLILIKVVNGYATSDGLAPIQVGPSALLERAYKTRTLIQVDSVYLANVAMLSLGAFMLMVWWGDRMQHAIGFMGAAAMFWGLGVTAWIAPNPFTGLIVWERLAYMAMVWAQLMLCMFFWRFSGRRGLAMDALVYGLMVVAPAWAMFSTSGWRMAVTFGVIYILLVVCLGLAVYHAIKIRRPDWGALVLGACVLAPSMAHDIAYQLNWLPLDSTYLLAYVAPFMVTCIVYMLAGDYGRSRRALSDLNADLSVTVARREHDLRESLQRLAELERGQAVSAERTRILRDMHDGVGTHLTSALRQLQSPRDAGVDLVLVTQTLRDSLDQLKLSVDALSLAPGDVAGLLASLRFRLTPRLKAAGLELVWDMGDLPVWPQGHAPALRQLQYILFEGVSNVLQHAGATRVVLAAHACADDLEISLTDNGRGWRSEAEGDAEVLAEGQGLQAMRARARVIGAQIVLTTTAQGGVALHVILPLSQPPLIALSSVS